MKGQTPSTWSPASEKQNPTKATILEPFGEGLPPISTKREELDPPPVNQTIYQAFEWYTPSWSTPVTVPTSTTQHDPVGPSATTITTSKPIPSANPSHYTVISSLLPSLASLGVTTIWLPPGCKASNPKDNGYGIYDLYDLGEFEWKGSKGTKWGTKDELVELGKKAEDFGIGLLWDAVLNHRAAGDAKEMAKAVVCHPKNRTLETSAIHPVETWTKFTFPARANKYSTQTLNWRHFTGIDWDDLTHRKQILRLVGDAQTPKPGWSPHVDDELGNYDYLMFADLDHTHADVIADTLHWATWLPGQIPGITGFRLDAIKHYSARFQYTLLQHLRSNPKTKDYLVVGEYWRADSQYLATQIDRFHGHMTLFDVKLAYNFHDASYNRITDLRLVMADSLVTIRPRHAVTFVANHDTQATQSLAAPVREWFVPHAYALILLRRDGIPCVFHGDVFGTLGPRPREGAMGGRLMRLCLARRRYAYGAQHDYPASRTCIGFTREGHAAHSAGAGVAVVLNTAWKFAEIRMFVGRRHAGERWVDVLGWSWDGALIDGRGWGVFRVGCRGVGVWVWEGAEGVEGVRGLVWPRLGLGEGEDDEEEVVGKGKEM